MLESLHLRDFTAFSEADFQFAKGLNVVIGENGSGKTHVLKAAYSLVDVCARGKKDSLSATPTKKYLQSALASKLNGVFKPDRLGRLTRRNTPGHARGGLRCVFSDPDDALSLSFNTRSTSEVVVDETPSTWLDKLPVYLPTRELLTLYPGLVALYETTHFPIEETWRDTCLLLGAPLARGVKERRSAELLAPLEDAMGGKVELDEAGRFYLKLKGGANMEMHLVAEGLRKLAMLARLIATGSLIDKGFLFWDEPEANLNPKIIRVIAPTILHLCKAGIQVFIASHSLFLMREFDILLQSEEFQKIDTRFFGLHRGEKGYEIRQGDSGDEVGDIDALQEELIQADRYLEMGTGA